MMKYPKISLLTTLSRLHAGKQVAFSGERKEALERKDLGLTHTQAGHATSLTVS